MAIERQATRPPPARFGDSINVSRLSNSVRKPMMNSDIMPG